MYTLYSGLIGRNGLIGKHGLVGAVCEQAYAKLSKDNDNSYTMMHYIAEVDRWLEQVAMILRDGLVLLSVKQLVWRVCARRGEGQRIE
jgi:hypothetical protein